MAYIISGLGKNKKILIGRAGIKLPLLERKDALMLKQISIDIKTNGYVPTHDFIGVDIDAVAKVRVMTEPVAVTSVGPDGKEHQRMVNGIELAAKNFLNMREEEIVRALTDSLQGNMREIIGTVDLKELNTDRKKFGDEVQEKAQKDMNALGIQIISCNIQKIEDENGLITALGQDNMSQISKNAAIAKALAEKEVKVAQADANREANEAEVQSQTVIAERNNELEIKRAELKRISDAKKAEADAAYTIQEQEQQRSIQTATVNAQIAKAEREAELKRQEVNVQEEMLNASVRKQADAERYAAEQAAEADLITRQKQAEAMKYAALQEAEGIKAKGEAEAEAIRAKGIAEAEAMEKKAEAYAKYNNAAIVEMMVKIMPQMAAEIAKPLSAIDKVNIYGGSAGESGVSSISGNMPVVMKQVFDTMSEATGVDFTEILKAGTYSAKVNRNINVTGLEGKAVKGKDEGSDTLENPAMFEKDPVEISDLPPVEK
jgi:flotillin